MSKSPNGRANYQALAGLTVNEYVALPGNARISVCFNSEKPGYDGSMHSSSTSYHKYGEGFI